MLIEAEVLSPALAYPEITYVVPEINDENPPCSWIKWVFVAVESSTNLSAVNVPLGAEMALDEILDRTLM